MATSGLIPINVGGRNFNILMSLYDTALNQVEEELTRNKKII